MSVKENKIALHHNIYLELISNKECEVFSDDIFVWKYTIHGNEFIIYYEISKNKINIRGMNIDGLNLIRKFNYSLNKKIIYENQLILSEDEYIKYLIYVAQVYVDENYYNKCCICDTAILIKNNEIKCCENIDCKKTFNCIPTNNIITKSFGDTPVFDFVFECFSSVLKHPKYDVAMKNNIPIMDGVTNLQDLKNIVPENISNNDKKVLFDQIKNSTNDVVLSEKINSITYGILKNMFTGNYFSIYSTSIVDEKVLKKTSVSVLNINHSGLTENIFKEKKNILFHGSSIHSWYTILKNGLVNQSGTALMANGAAYGNGIYLSDLFSFASGYSRNIQNYSVVIGVFLLNDDLEKYKKSSNIYVVADCSKLILKSLIITDGNTTHNISTQIQNSIKSQDVECRVLEESVFKLKNKRLNKEYEFLKTKEYIKNIDIVDDKQWMIMLKTKKDVISVEAIFNNYPMISPSIILKNNNTKIKTKVINGTTVLDLEILNPNNWRISTKLVDIMTNIIENV
jgi:hypothetical protein